MDALIVTMIKIVVAMAVGFLLYKLKIFNTTVNKGLSGLIVNVTTPCLLFYSITTMDSSEKANAVTLLWVCAIVYVVLAGLAFLITKILKVEKEASGVFQAAMIFGNVGFLGLPIAESLFGSVGLFYMALMNMHFNLSVYSYGYYLIKKDAKGKNKFKPKDLINAGIIGITLAIIVYFCEIPIPEFIMEPIHFVGSITSPLAMIIIGSSAAAYSLKKVFIQKKVYIMSAIKLLVIPLITFFVFKAIWGNTVMTQVLTLYVGMPTAAIVGMTAILAEANADQATYATVMMNLLCLITIPILFFVMNM